MRDMMTILQIYCAQRIGPANPHWAIYCFKTEQPKMKSIRLINGRNGLLTVLPSGGHCSHTGGAERCVVWRSTWP